MRLTSPHHYIGQRYVVARLEGFSAHDLRHRFGYVMSEKTLEKIA
ncbi:hypothetical protein JIR001_26510 [Polycladomyces abyssicola]|uniref:Uncharacterized protein n=1 Tax=Polycladomyces abyssicola TaxID=1125966 RepID=A0A8D5UIU8_9BACL|nr:hypothetical protein [Polycladomyces abyssicola]BCU82868.1 hypothetical protein JIR001_26510 [Polycladomyces abyssicola]